MGQLESLVCVHVCGGWGGGGLIEVKQHKGQLKLLLEGTYVEESDLKKKGSSKEERQTTCSSSLALCSGHKS